MKRQFRITSILLTLVLILCACPITLSSGALSAGDEVKGNTVCQALGMDGGAYLSWLSSHEHDSYYLGTPYRPYDHRNPNGDCKGAYGWLDSYGVPGMNCMGFVWHVLYKATSMSGGYVSRANRMAAGRLTFYEGLNISRKYFKNKQAMLKSGYLEKGDIIWMIPDQQEYSGTVYHHVGIYWGDGHSDVLWHSNTVTGGQGECNAISKIYPMLDRNTMYIVLKVGASMKSAPKLTNAYNIESGVKLTWNKVAGAKRYRVFVKQSGRWKGVGDTSANYFVYGNGVDGKSYTFTVRCITPRGGCYTSYYDRRGISCTCCPAPQVTLQNATDGVLLRWNKLTSAARYRVYVRTSKGYTCLAVTTDTVYRYIPPKANYPYTFTVRAVMSDGAPGAYKVNGFRITYIAPPKISAIQKTSKGVRLNWTKPDGAVYSFRVFRREDGRWKRLADTSATAYTDTAATEAGVYAYAVRCLSADKKQFITAYDAAMIVVSDNKSEE